MCSQFLAPAFKILMRRIVCRQGNHTQHLSSRGRPRGYAASNMGRSRASSRPATPPTCSQSSSSCWDQHEWGHAGLPRRIQHPHPSNIIRTGWVLKRQSKGLLQQKSCVRGPGGHAIATCPANPSQGTWTRRLLYLTFGGIYLCDATCSGVDSEDAGRVVNLLSFCEIVEVVSAADWDFERNKVFAFAPAKFDRCRREAASTDDFERQESPLARYGIRVESDIESNLHDMESELKACVVVSMEWNRSYMFKMQSEHECKCWIEAINTARCTAKASRKLAISEFEALDTSTSYLVLAFSLYMHMHVRMRAFSCRMMSACACRVVHIDTSAPLPT